MKRVNEISQRKRMILLLSEQKRGWVHQAKADNAHVSDNAFARSVLGSNKEAHGNCFRKITNATIVKESSMKARWQDQVRVTCSTLS